MHRPRSFGPSSFGSTPRVAPDSVPSVSATCPADTLACSPNCTPRSKPRVDTRVARVARDADSGVAIEFTDDARSPEHFDRVVLTVPAPLAARLAPDLEPGERERLASKTYGGIVCASVLLDAPLGPYYVTNLTDDWVPFTGVIDMSNVVDRSAWNGGALVYLPKYVKPDDPLFDASDEAIEESFLGALERMYPSFSRDRVRAFRVSRVRHVFPIATLGYSRSLPGIETSIPGLYTLNSAHIVNGTLNVNETLALVDRGLAAIGVTAGARA